MAKTKKFKKYEIRSIDDLINLITEENCDMLFGNFYGTVKQFVEIRKKHPKIKYLGFDWIDDGKMVVGKPNITIQIESTEEVAKLENKPKSKKHESKN